MKQDPYFKYLVVIILAGLAVSFFDAPPAATTAIAPVGLPAVVSAASHGHQARS